MGLYFLGKLNYYEGINYITLYLSFVHTPEHYYQVLSNTHYLYQHLIMILCTTLFSMHISPPIIQWIEITSGNNGISHYIGGIIMSHILFNEYIG